MRTSNASDAVRWRSPDVTLVSPLSNVQDSNAYTSDIDGLFQILLHACIEACEMRPKLSAC